MKGKTHKIVKNIRNLPLKVKAEMAFKEAVAEAIAEHKRQGNPIAVWRNGKAVWIPPEEIVVPKG
jgi:phosphotransacetylase